MRVLVTGHLGFIGPVVNYGGDTLADPFGYPMRLRTAVKLGYKNPVWWKCKKSRETAISTFPRSFPRTWLAPTE
jgi:DMSO/TMAO reductase YedYZ molybdopterin-dependent catalytic subunit